MNARGGALASTLIVILFLTVFGLTLVNLSTFDLRTSSRNNQREAAFNAAETGLETVIGELSLDPRTGKMGETFSDTLADGSSYTVTFDTTSGLPYSVNNLDDLTSGESGYNGRTVPPLHALLFARGVSSQGEEAVVECLIRLEGLPYAVAGTGRVTLNNVGVWGSQRLSEAGAPTLSGNTYSGALGPDSTRLLGLTRVSGDARSAGGISVLAPAAVNGEVEPDHEPENLPDLVITDFRNDGTPGVSLRIGAITLDPLLTGQVYFDSDTILTGASILNDATVFVNGDLTVAGTLIGTGTLFVTGETSFLNAIDLGGTNRVTLFSQGDINIALASVFQGVLYTHGNINTGPLLATTIFGAAYAVNYSDPSKGNVNLGSGSNVVHVSELTAFASSYLGRSGEANALRVYWSRVK